MKVMLQVDKQACLWAPMRDGVALAADLHRPRKAGRYPAILIRTPYGRSGPRETAEFFAARGYAVLAVDARGTGSSEGRFDYYNVTEGLHDGYDLVEWLAARDFCDGNVGTTGGSALGIYQILTGGSRPPHLRCMCASAYPLDFYADSWRPGGVLRLQGRLQWCRGVALDRCGPGSVFNAADGELDEPTRRRLQAVFLRRWTRRQSTPADAEELDWARPLFQTDVRGPVWDAIDLTPHMRNTPVPVLHAGILHDHFGVGTIRGYQVHGGPKRLVMLPGDLGFAGEEGDLEPRALELAWFEKFLKGRDLDVLTPRVMFYATGAGRWLAFDDLPAGRVVSLCLGADGSLGPERTGQRRVELRHDPACPVLTPQNLRAAPASPRQDAVLTFATAPFPRETTVLGHPELRLRVRTDMADANLIAWIGCEEPDGSICRLNFAPQRLALRDSLDRVAAVPQGGDMDLTLRFWTISHVFLPGRRLRLWLSLSDYPFFENSPRAGSCWIDSAASELRLPVL